MVDPGVAMKNQRRDVLLPVEPRGDDGSDPDGSKVRDAVDGGAIGSSLAVAHQLRGVMRAHTVSWTPSAYLHLEDRPVTDPVRAATLVADAFNDARLQQDITALTDHLPEEQLWNLYFQAYDKIVCFSKGYVDLTERAHQALPERGIIGDLGAGTGNFSCVMLWRSPRREVLAIDISGVGLDITRQKAKALGVDERLHTHQQSLLELREVLCGQSVELDGAVLNNVLYRIPANERISLLRDICASLTPGGRLVLSDPVRDMQQSPANAHRVFADVTCDAVQSGSPMTEYDLALVAAMNRIQLLEGSPDFMSLDELTRMVREVGCDVIGGPERTYYGGCTTLVLERPMKAPGPEPVGSWNSSKLK